MTDPGDPLSRRYRELAREEPPAALDAAILAASKNRVRPSSRWMVPTSIAAVLVLGIGVSLRMQLEEPGIETSVPASTPAQYPKPAPAPQAAPKELAAEPTAASPMAEQRTAVAKKPQRPPGSAAKPDAKRRDAVPEPNPFTDAPIVVQQAPAGTTSPAAPFAAAPPPARADESVPSADALQPRAKREAASAELGVQALRKSLAAADPDPLRELERIAKLREAGNHPEADRLLEQFRRSHPDFRIPEAMWERVKRR